MLEPKWNDGKFVEKVKKTGKPLNRGARPS
jgi:hypothetical protein